MELSKIILKHLISSKEYFNRVMPILKGKYFDDISDKNIFDLVKLHYEKYDELPTVTEICAHAQALPDSKIREMIIKNVDEINKIETVNNIKMMLDSSVKFVRDAIHKEILIIGAEALAEGDDKKRLKSFQLIEEFAKVRIEDKLGLDLNDIKTMIEYYSSRTKGVKTGHQSIDDRLGDGFLVKSLSIILAPAGVGKSFLMTDFISNMVKKGLNILLVSLEMQDKEIMKRVHANAMNLPINSLTDLNKTEKELELISKYREIIRKEDIIKAYDEMMSKGNVGKFKVNEYPAGTFSPLMLDNLLNQYKMQENLTFDIVFVDYMGIMKSDLLPASVGLYSYVKSIAEELRKIAAIHELPIVSASQLNRAAYKDHANADNSTISDSIGTAQTADFMLFILQDEEMKKRNEILCKVTKNRFTGITDSWLMGTDYEHMAILDLDDGNRPLNKHQEKFVATELAYQAITDAEIVKNVDSKNKTEKSIEEILSST